VKKILLPLLYLLVIFTSCKKDDVEEQSKGFIQIQKIETNERTYNFQYNDKNLLSRFEILQAPEGGGAKVLLKYAVVNFENNQPVSADLYEKKQSSTDLYRHSHMTYHYNSQERLISTEREYFDENGSLIPDMPENIFVHEFDAQDRIVKIKLANYEIHPFFIFGYDAKGDLFQPEQTYNEHGAAMHNVYEQSYEAFENPFLANGLGVALYTLNYNYDFTGYELFSPRMPLRIKSVSTMISDLGVYKTTDISKYTNTFDKDGILTAVSWESTIEYRKDDVVESENTVKENFKYTCIRKLQ